MQRGNSEERIISGNTSPRLSHKSSNSTFFGLFGRRTTKVEPQLNNDDPLIYTTTASKEHNISFAKCLTDSNEGSIDTSVIATANRLNNNINSTLSLTQATARVKTRSHTLPLANCINNNMEKSYTSSSSGGVSGGFLNLHRRIKSSPPVTKCSTFISGFNTAVNLHSNDGSQSDGGGDVVLRVGKSSKHRSPNHNRFSHQFNLCCKTERKPMTPPVTVRYNSLATAGGDYDVHQTNSPQLSFTTSDVVAATAVTIKCLPPPLQAPLNPSNVNVSSSAPQSPVTTKTTFSLPNSSSHSSPSNSSLKSTQSETPCGALSKSAGGPIRPIAVTACRSRLRLKLLPPGKEMPKQFIQLQTPSNEPVDTAWKPTSSPKHMSSPNISTNPIELNTENSNAEMRFLSHENIQMTKQKSQGGGLAMQALMAAQVLSLIPTEKARERSFLSGRLGSSTLMGPSELNRVLPSKEVTVFVGTWNMNGQSPPKQMNDFILPTSVEHVPDIVAIGTQESSPDRFEWEASIQETLGPSHVLFHAATLGTLHLAIFIRRDLIWYCSAPEDASMSVRTGSAFRTKGAVAISFCLFGTSILFVTSHLTAHQQKVKERVSDVKRITHALDLPKNLQLRHKSKDVTQNFDDVFWCGDLNFRLSEPREKLLEWIQHTKFPLPSHLPHGYMHTDQLSSVLADGAAFRGFMEANITFPPTYKYDPGTQHFDTSSKQRAPAYTDRILYKFRQPQGFSVRRQSTTPGGTTNVQPYIQCSLYDSVPSIITSDHKPVLALFKVLIRAGTDAIPLAGGLFNREIYLEGIRRRLNNQHQGSSAVCSIQ